MKTEAEVLEERHRLRKVLAAWTEQLDPANRLILEERMQVLEWVLGYRVLSPTFDVDIPEVQPLFKP